MSTPRTGGRVLMFDESGRLLLIHERLDDGSTHWLTPGGGLEGDEHPRDAARREAMEETGIELDLAADAEAVLVTRRTWSWGTHEYDQTDHFFLARVPDGTVPVAHALTDTERRTLLGMRWWTRAQLAATADVLLPPDLADVLTRLVPEAGG